MSCGGRKWEDEVDENGNPVIDPETGKVKKVPPKVGVGATGLGGQISLATAAYNITPMGSAQNYIHAVQSWYGEQQSGNICKTPEGKTYKTPTREEAIAHYESVISTAERFRDNPPPSAGINTDDPKEMKAWEKRMDNAAAAAKREVMWLRDPANRVPTAAEYAVLREMPEILNKFFVACRCKTCGKFVAPQMGKTPRGQQPSLPPQPETCPKCVNAKPKIVEKRAARVPVEDLSELMRNKEPRAVLSPAEPVISSTPAAAAAGGPSLLLTPPAPVAPLRPAPQPQRLITPTPPTPQPIVVPETPIREGVAGAFPAVAPAAPRPVPLAAPIALDNSRWNSPQAPAESIPDRGGSETEKSAFQTAAENAVGVYNCPKCGRWASTARPCLCPPKVEDLSNIPEVALLREELARMEAEALPEVQALRDEINSGVFDDDPAMKQEAIMAEEEIEDHVRQLREEIDAMERDQKPPFGPETDELGNPIAPPPARPAPPAQSPSAVEAGAAGRVMSRFLLNPKGWRMMAPYAFRAALVVGPVLLFAGTGLGPIAWIAAAFFAYRGQKWLRFDSGENKQEILDHYNKPYWFQQGRAKTYLDKVKGRVDAQRNGDVIETPDPAESHPDPSQERDYDQELRDAGYGEALNNPGGATVR